MAVGILGCVSGCELIVGFGMRETWEEEAEAASQGTENVVCRFQPPRQLSMLAD